MDGEAAQGVGEFGVRLPGGRSGAEAVRQTVLPLREPSILRAAVERRRSYTGPLEPTRVNLALVERLGGGQVREAVAVPLVVGGEVRFVLYGDNAPVGTAARPARDARVLGGAGRPHHREDPRRAREARPTGPPERRPGPSSPLPTRRPRAYSRPVNASSMLSSAFPRW